LQALGPHAGTDQAVRQMLIAWAEKDGDLNVRYAAVGFWAREFGDRKMGALLSQHLNGSDPWCDPLEVVTDARVTAGAERLCLSKDEVRAVYEEIAKALPLRLEWLSPA
jgi:hypothetical protein